MQSDLTSARWRLDRVAALPLAAALIAAALTLTGCGQGDPLSLFPSSLSPTQPPASNGAACAAIGTAAAAGQAIVNGTACSTTTSPIALLRLRDADGFAAGACSGTVIGARAVLTAAHCVTDDVAQILVDFGGGDPVPSASLHRHAAYRANASDSLDVGVVLTSQDLGRPVIPLLAGRDAGVGEEAVVAGWGDDENDVSRVLRAGMTSVTSVGAAFLETRYSRSASSICAGDSGGALLVHEGGVWVLAGVISASSGVSCTSGTSYYANVRHPGISSFILGLVPDAIQR